MKKISLIFISCFIILISCDQTPDGNDQNSTDSDLTASIEDKAVKAVTSLPEYADAQVHVNALTNGEQSLSLIIEAPNENHSDYYIQAGFNQESWFETYYHFYVNTKTFKVSIEDVIEGDIISIEEWRKREKNR